ncbi:hypothetical protein [Cyanobium sp. Morenito 9A2]|uniref:hypothetical protein n=1 Tax=Cyanobium sp. Morenito 9A2 TaxID=2823718 RepID=UPI0020CFC1D7|nr:hypothetical protein [Cyanobium sp. Morenito 9A2]
MTSESVSFRITRTAEELARTVTALSHRLVSLEQRLAGLELQAEHRALPGADELETLDSVERLLVDCRALLEDSALPTPAPMEAIHPQVIGQERGRERQESIARPSDDHGEQAYAA